MVPKKQKPGAKKPAKGAKEKKVFRFKYDIASGKLTDITEQEKEKDYPRWANISPDGKYIIGDTYPRDGMRSIEAINLETGACRTLLRAETVIPTNPDIRCDLHNRFVFDGSAISYDTTQNGRRQIAMVDLRALNF